MPKNYATAASKLLDQLDEHLTPGRMAHVRRKVADIPDRYKLVYLRALLSAVTGRGSMRQAIKAHCLECCGWQRNEVRGCTSVKCPLWDYRPYQ